MAQAHPACTARTIIEAMPTALEEDDPFLGVGLLAQIETRMAAIVARDARVGQHDTLQRATMIILGAIYRR